MLYIHAILKVTLISHFRQEVMFSYVPSFVRAARSQKHKYEKNDGIVNTDLVGSR